MTAFYNEKEPYAAQWLRNLIAAGLIAPGVVDERDVRDIRPDELADFTQVHLFAGIGIWSYALRRAGWPDHRPVWTASFPCQPFSAAGAGDGFADERHLWPHGYHLISQCKPVEIFGEQVASKDGLTWLDLVHADMEAAGYAFGSTDTCAAGFGAPHIRQRLYWVANDDRAGQRRQQDSGIQRPELHDADGRGEHGELAESETLGRPGRPGYETGQRTTELGSGDDYVSRFMAHPNGGQPSDRDLQRSWQHRQQPEDGGVVQLADGTLDRRREERQDAGRIAGGDRAEGVGAGLVSGGAVGVALGDANLPRSQGRLVGGVGPGERFTWPAGVAGPTRGFWAGCDWIYCQDGKFRPVESGTFPLAHGDPNRVGRLRAYGNAIVAEQAAAFIAAYLEGPTDEIVFRQAKLVI